ncbi:hypothetical protein NOVO_01010 [Rickettsiales bacterium Ac37b]|nr:hypothetical protein NOVO_01010 [Rickettsiales bacterium Ac37b]
MYQYSILQKGIIYFIYRPKVETHPKSSGDDIQHFFIVLKPETEKQLIVLVVGKKKLPNNKEHHFAFVNKIESSLEAFMEDFEEKTYFTHTKGKRTLPAAKLISEGSYIISDHHNHTHLFYTLTSSSERKDIKKFGIMQYGDFIIHVKNPNSYSPSKQGLSANQKALYPNKLQNIFKDYKFIPVKPVDFLNYEGAEILLTGTNIENIKREEQALSKCIHEIEHENILRL